MPFLTALGVCSYNGYDFDASSRVTVACEMVKDEARRTVIYQKQVFTIRATIADNTATDTTLEQIKALLGEQGKPFIYTERGFGNDVLVNTPGGVKDLKFGPIPEMLNWEPIGDKRACEIEFQLTIHVPHCEGTTRDKGVMAFNYSADFSIERGNTTRTISGYLEIAQTRSGRRAPDCADLYRHLIKPALPDGFERRQNFSISKDKSRLDFTVTDSQINSKFAYPAGVVTADGRHRASWTTSNRSRTQQRNTISMELEMVPGVSQAQAWAIFGTIVKKRIDWAKRQRLPVLLDELVAEEDVWGRSSSFSISYRILKSCAACLAQHAGLWQPIDTDWRRWKLSMESIYGDRGHAGMRLPPGDAIIDLCGAASPISTPEYTDTRKEPLPKFAAVFKNDIPPPADSYLFYDQAIVPMRDRPVQVQSFLQESETRAELMGSDLDEGAPFGFGKAGGTASVVQEGGRSTYSVQLVGQAQRAGRPVPRPSLETLGKQNATEINCRLMQRIVGNWLGVPIFEAAWVISYALEGSPGDMKMEPNIKEGVDANGKADCKC